MSLVNEALKRTRDSSFGGGGPVAAPTRPGYRLGQPAPRAWFGAWHFVIIAVVGCALMGGAYQFARVRLGAIQQGIDDGSVASGPVLAAAASAGAGGSEPRGFPVVSPEQARAAEAALMERLVARMRETPAPVAAVVAESPAAPIESAPVVVAAVEPVPPTLKLQGIMRDHGSHEAMINGFNYRVGDTVEDGVVTHIDQRIVRVRFGERELELRLR